MDSPGMQIQPDPVAPPEAPKSRDVAPGKKRDDQSEGKETTAAAAALTVSFAEILKSKKLELKAGTEERARKDPAVKAKTPGLKAAEEKMFPVKGQSAAAGKQVKQSLAGAQAKAAREYAARENTAEPAELAMKTVQERPLAKESPGEAISSAELPKKGALSAVEEAQLKEMIQKKGAMPGRKDASAQMKGFVNGEPLNSREGIGAVKSMTAKEGKILDILSGKEETPAPLKLKNAKPVKAQQAFSPPGIAEGEGKAAQVVPPADKMKLEFERLAESAQDKLAAAGPAKKQAVLKEAGAENRAVLPARGDMAAPVQDKAAGSPSAARPQAVMSQALDGAFQVLRNGSGRMALSLQPPRLGTLELDVVVQDNRVKMVLLADNQEVKQILQSGMDDLRNALQEKGFQIDRLEVLVQNRPDEAGSGFWQEAGFAREESPGRGERRREAEAANAAQGLPERTVRAGDGGISIFA